MSQVIVLNPNNVAEIKKQTGYTFTQKGDSAQLKCDKASFENATIIVPLNSVVYVSNGLLFVPRSGYTQECEAFPVAE